MSSNRSDRDALRGLTAREWLLLVGTAGALPISLLLLKALGYQRTIRIGERCSRTPRPTGDAGDRAASTTRVVWAVDERLPLPTTCLSRSVALWYLLRLQGVGTDIRIGVRAGGRPLDAHVWVELDGEALNDTADIAEHYAVFQPRDPRG